MTWLVDARVPVRVGALACAGADDALLIEGEAAVAATLALARFAMVPGAHAPGCACCGQRNPAALALHTLFQARARAEVPFFRRVLAVIWTAEAELALRAALREDPLVSGRYRPE